MLLAVAVTRLHIHTAHISVTSAVELDGAELIAQGEEDQIESKLSF